VPGYLIQRLERIRLSPNIEGLASVSHFDVAEPPLDVIARNLEEEGGFGVISGVE
jgi:hypothetical protein